MRTTMFLCGDVMLGRGIDQALPYPCSPELAEGYVTDAREYVRLAAAVHGEIVHPMSFATLWGELRDELLRQAVDLSLVNLETAITRRGAPWPSKEVCYRVSPENARALCALGVSTCALANNHSLDWGHAGLEDTLATLDQLSISHAGAGRTRVEAEAPAVLTQPEGSRVLVFSACMTSAGVPEAWAATASRAGVNLLDLSEPTFRRVQATVQRFRAPGDLVVLSVHWGGNWGYEIASEERRFAHRLIDEAGVDLVHGHSSHHVKGIEVHEGRLILHGCGDLLTDYEGICGHEQYRGELGLAYFPTYDVERRRLVRLSMVPTEVRNFRLRCRDRRHGRWLADLLCREGAALGTRAELCGDGSLELAFR